MGDPLVELGGLERRPDADGVDRLLTALVGESLFGFRGVLHLTAVWSPPSRPSEPIVMKINPSTPRSELDFFMLNAARAWADAVFTTGRILREEPGLNFELAGRGKRALGLWRARSAGDRGQRSDYPALLILTSGRGLDLDQCVFDACRRGEQVVHFVTGTDTEQDLRDRVEGLALPIQVHALEPVGARSLIEWARQRGYEHLAVEAGPSSALSLYDPPVLIDRLWLSRYRAPSLPEAVRGGAFLELSGTSTSLEARGRLRFGFSSGDWQFGQWQAGGEIASRL